MPCAVMLAILSLTGRTVIKLVGKEAPTEGEGGRETSELSVSAVLYSLSHDKQHRCWRRRGCC